ncbi:MAG TPA: class I SAM-dependent methyltransferase [Dehalococcoidia bacterium]|nr:class I SAM-dependent methyltransferase [Dehalococcoidia bacterium]
MTTTAAARFDKIAANFATSEVHSSSPTMRRLHELIALPESAAVCDVACGAGHLALSFSGRAARICGVDPAPAMLDAFATLASERGVAVECIQAYAERIPLPDASFDLVVTRLAAHHFARIEAAVAEMARLTRPGGSVAVIDLEGDAEPAIDAFNHRLELLHDPTHVRSYPAARWRELLEDAGLRVEALERRQRESPAGVPSKRWCEIAGSGAAAEAAIRDLLAAADPATREALGIEADGEEFRIPVRTVLLVAGK